MASHAQILDTYVERALNYRDIFPLWSDFLARAQGRNFSILVSIPVFNLFLCLVKLGHDVSPARQLCLGACGASFWRLLVVHMLSCLFTAHEAD